VVNGKIIRDLEYRKTYLWDVKFLNPPLPKPFESEWFPATSLTDNFYEIQSQNFETVFGSISVPSKYNVGSLDLLLTFHDTIDCIVEEWLRSWKAFMFPDVKGVPNCVRRLAGLVGKVEVNRLDVKYGKVKNAQRVLYVYPEGNLAYNGTNDSGFDLYSQNFKVVGSKK
jgi:hypothetical protein